MKTIKLFLGVCIATASASVWTTTGGEELFKNIEKIEFHNVLVPARGNIKLAPAVSPLCSLPETTVWDIICAPDRTLYLGTGDRAGLYRKTTHEHQPSLLWSGDEGEITALALLADGTIVWGTTPGGKIYRRAPGAGVELLAETEAGYIYALLPAPDRSLLCATGPDGKLFRILPEGRKELLFTAPQAHLTALTWLKNGRELLVGTSPDGIVYRLSFTPGEEKIQTAALYDTPYDEIKALAVDKLGRIYLAANPDEKDGTNLPAVFCIDENGIQQWQWNCPDSAIFDIFALDSLLYVLTGNRGVVYALDSLARPRIVTQLNASQLVSAAGFKNTLYIGTANPAYVYQFTARYADSGYITSPPFDCGNPATFGKIAVRATVPAGTELSIETRTGNSETPDSLWSSWQPAAEKISSPPGRFIQWRAKLYSRFPGLTPELEMVQLFYAAVNRPPQISRLELTPLTDSDARRGNAQPRRTINWEAADPDGDSLIYQLFIRPEEENRWQQLTQNISENRYELDTRTLPDGWYRLRLVVSDAGDRPASSARTVEYVTLPFIIDNTPPRITGLAARGKNVVWQVSDALSPIAASRISINAGPWVPVAPRDGIFDSTAEDFTFQLPPGTNTIAVWATDAQGNTTLARLRLNP